MQIKTHIIKNDEKSYTCNIIFENGKIQKTIFKDRMLTNQYNVENPTDFRLEKLYSKSDYKKIHKFTHKLKFINSNNKPYRIFINLNIFQLILLNWSVKKYWIQHTNNWVKFIIPIITSLATYLITKNILC